MCNSVCSQKTCQSLFIKWTLKCFDQDTNENPFNAFLRGFVAHREVQGLGDVLRVVPLEHLHVDDAVDVDGVEVRTLR